MKASSFNGYKGTNPVANKEVSEYFEHIRLANNKDRVLKVRAAKTKEEKDELKATLFQFAFAGVFKYRNKEGLKSGSGLAVLDYDEDIDNPAEFRDTISTNPHVVAAFISASGRGIKAIVRIPAVNSDDEYKSYWICLRDRFTELYGKKIDESGKDVCRMCCETYDPDIYVNLDAEIFTEYFIDNTVYPAGDITNIPIEDQDIIANNLLVWFNNSVAGKQGRNSSTHILAAAFNDFGVSKQTAYDYLYRFAESDFKQSEIKQCVDSAYKKTAQFGSKAFEDAQKVQKVKALVMNGKSTAEIAERIGGNSEAIGREIERQKERILSEDYWTIDDKGKPIFNPLLFKYWLQRHGFNKYYPAENTKTFAFIQKEGDFVVEVYNSEIKDFVLDQLESDGEVKMYNQMAISTKRFSSDFLSIMSTIRFSTLKDTKNESYLYYKNGVLKVTAQGRELIPYSEIKEVVWKKQIIDRIYTGNDHHDSEYREFIWLISDKNVQKYNTIKSTIGYFLNNYKNPRTNRAVILNDSVVNGENPEGGSGKGLYFRALSYMKNLVVIDGKTFDPKGTFAYQTVSLDTQIILVDDVPKGYKFETQFSLVTDGMTIEYKGQGALKLTVEDSAKIGITSNYGLKGVGGSHDRRKFEIALSGFFHAKHTPFDYFKHELFYDWDELEWQRFDSFMINCLEFYLKNGLVEGQFASLKETALMNSINPVVYTYYKEGFLKIGKEYTIDAIQDTMKDLITEYQKVPNPATIHKSISVIEAYMCLPEHKRHNTNGRRWFTLGNSVVGDETLGHRDLDGLDGMN